MSESVTTSQTALPSTSSYQNLITAEIRVENLSATPMEQTATISVPSSSQQSLVSSNKDEPEVKRQKLDNPRKVKKIDKLENRLRVALCCAVCLDLPRANLQMFQCCMGHLMCAGCFTHLLADGRLRDQVATCPNCRVEISKNNASRNLAVEKAVSELPSECQYCNQEFPRSSLDHHEKHECEERTTKCKYSIIGCQWNGPTHETKEHESSCAHPKKSGADVISALAEREASYLDEKKLFSNLVDLLSYEKIIFNDLQMKSYRTDEFCHKLFYETARFSAFNQQWIVKAIINNSQRDVHQTNDREITYQLTLKSKTQYPMNIQFFVLPGPFSDMKVNTKIYKHDFTDNENESSFNLLPLPDNAEVNKLLSAKTINFRLIMFLASN